MEYKGLRWKKCDLHIHTNMSKCFEGVYDEQIFIDKVKEKDLDVIAITDHNGCGNIDLIKEKASKEGIIVFPGVEVTVGESHSHLLILFDADKGDSDVEDF